jgi:hypothetical protein
MTARWMVVAAVLEATAVRADPVPRREGPGPEPQPGMAPVLTIDDTRTQGPVARYSLEGSVQASYVLGRDNADGSAGSVGRLDWQLGLGPIESSGQVADVIGPLRYYALRVRGSIVSAHDGTVAGPLTIGLQRYSPLEPLAINPLVHAHLGIEAQLATPWLSDDTTVPPRALSIVDSADTELSRSGWSLRPVSMYVRGDFLACRSWYVELGLAPEMFVPTGQSAEYDVRFHGALGRSFACLHQGDSLGHHLAFQVEYRGRGRLYSPAGAADYHDGLAVALQVDSGRFLAQLIVEADPGRQMDDAIAVGLRIQIGLFGRRR